MDIENYNGEPVSVIIKCDLLDGSVAVTMGVTYVGNNETVISDFIIEAPSEFVLSTNIDVEKIEIEYTVIGVAKLGHRLNINGNDRDEAGPLTIEDTSSKFVYNF